MLNKPLSKPKHVWKIFHLIYVIETTNAYESEIHWDLVCPFHNDI